MARPVSSRSQDDAMVSYIFQRPQSDGNFQSFGKHQSRWLGDESIVEVIYFLWVTDDILLITTLIDRSSRVLPMMLPKHHLLSQRQSTVSSEANLIRYVSFAAAFTYQQHFDIIFIFIKTLPSAALSKLH